MSEINHRYFIHSFLKIIVLLLILICGKVFGQTSPLKIITMNEAVKEALTNNPISRNYELKVQVASCQKQSIMGLGNTQVNYSYGQIYSTLKDHYFEVVQNFGSPVTFSRKRTLVKQNILLSESEQKLAIKQLTVEVKSAYVNVIYQRNKLKILHEESLLFADFSKMVNFCYEPGESSLPGKTMAETQYADLQNQLFQAEQDYQIASNQLQQVVFTNSNLLPSDTLLEMYSIQFSRIGPDKFFPADYLTYYERRTNVSGSAFQVERSNFFPEIYAGYFNHAIEKVKGFEGFKVGVSLPIWFLPQKAKMNEARINFEMSQNEYEYQKFSVQKTIENLKIQLDKLFVQISYFQENALNQADLLINTAFVKFTNQDLKYHEYLQNINDYYKIKLNYLETLRQYNITAFQLEYYIN